MTKERDDGEWISPRAQIALEKAQTEEFTADLTADLRFSSSGRLVVTASCNRLGLNRLQNVLEIAGQLLDDLDPPELRASAK
jgi:hypothetical protein